MDTVPGAAVAVQPDVRRAIYDARHLGDADAVAFRFDVSPEFVRSVWGGPNPRQACYRPNGGRKPPVPGPKLTPREVAELRAEFRHRAAGVTVRRWMEAAAGRLGVGHATVRRAVYGFGVYSDATLAGGKGSG